jgi:hypothetical protein
MSQKLGDSSTKRTAALFRLPPYNKLGTTDRGDVLVILTIFRDFSLETVSRIWEQFSLPKYLGY